MSDACLVVDDGGRIPLDVDRWRAGLGRADAALLDSLRDPVLDVGCGPGRVVAGLGAAGRIALGIDPSPTAAYEAGLRGATTLQRSVFDPLPGEGRWGTALLLDGNIGIGGDPAALLRRLRALVRRGGEVVAELAPDGGTTTLVVRLEIESRRGPPFPWATVGVEGWGALTAGAELERAEIMRIHDRWFGRAVRP